MKKLLSVVVLAACALVLSGPVFAENYKVIESTGKIVSIDPNKVMESTGNIVSIDPNGGQLFIGAGEGTGKIMVFVAGETKISNNKQQISYHDLVVGENVKVSFNYDGKTARSIVVLGPNNTKTPVAVPASKAQQ